MQLKPDTRKASLIAGVSALAICAVALAVPAQAQTATPTAKADDSDVVVVTARRKALLSADERKKNSDTIIDSVVADEAGKLPDNSITEVLQRVSGVTIVRFSSVGDPDHFSAEGSGIQVRGLSGTSGKLNGREVFSANGGRGISWGDVTPELMAAVDVYKSGTADIIEGGTGGAVDLRTKMPFDYKKPAFQGNIGETYGDLSKKWTPSASFLLTKRWDTPIGEIGALFDYGFSQYFQNTNFIRMEAFYKTQVKGLGDRYIPGGVDWGYDHFERERTGYYGALQWRPNDKVTVYTTLFSTRYLQHGYGQGVFATSQRLTVDPKLNDVSFDQNGGFVKGSLATFRASDGLVYDPVTGAAVGGTIGAGGDTGISKGLTVTSDWSTGFKWTPDEDFKLEGAIQFTDSIAKRRSYDVFPSEAFPGAINIDLTGDFPAVAFPDSTQYANLANYRFNATQDHVESNHGSLVAANLDADIRLSDDGLFRSVKAGVRYAERTEHDGVGNYNWTSLGGNVFFNSPLVRAGDIEKVNFDNFFRGETAPPTGVYLPSLEMVQRNNSYADHQAYDSVSGKANFVPALIKPQDRSDGSTKTASAYVMTRFAGDKSFIFNVPFSGNFGVRVVEVKNYASGFFTQSASNFIGSDGAYYSVPAIATGKENKGGLRFVRAMPNFNIQFIPDPSFRVRLAYGVTMDNPGFNVIKANGGLGINTIPNPNNTPAVPASPGVPAKAAVTYPNVLVNFTTFAGNPKVKPVMAQNFDLSTEWYKGRSFSAHFAMFYKRISDMLVYQTTSVEIPVTYAALTTTVAGGTPSTFTTGFTGTRTELAQKNDTRNVPDAATIKGFEIGARKFFDNLPKPFNGLGVEFNYTYIDSQNPGALGFAIDNVNSQSTTITGARVTLRDANGQVINTHPLTDNPLVGLSKHSANLVTMYEHGPFSVRLAYNWRSPYLMNTGSNGTAPGYTYYDFTGNKTQFIQTGLPLWSDEYGTLDFGGSYKIDDHLKLSFNAQNLTNSVTKTQMYGGYPGNANFTRSWFVADKRVNVALSFAY